MTIQEMIRVLDAVSGVIPSRQSIAICDVIDGLREVAASLEEMRQVIGGDETERGEHNG